MKVFIAGPRAIRKLDKIVEDRLGNISKKEYTVLVGDANGVDKLIQQYFFSRSYSDVVVFASKGQARNNIGKWKVENVEVPEGVKGFDFYAKKDEAMAKVADYGFMLWNGQSKGTLNNIINLIHDNKSSLVYFTPMNTFVNIDSSDKLQELLSKCPPETQTLFEKLNNKAESVESLPVQQLTLFDMLEDANETQI